MRIEHDGAEFAAEDAQIAAVDEARRPQSWADVADIVATLEAGERVRGATAPRAFLRGASDRGSLLRQPVDLAAGKEEGP